MKFGGAGGIRTHEWRFCRPLPWATWVPRRTYKYSKSDRTLLNIPGNVATAILLVFRDHRNLWFKQESRGPFRRRRIAIKTGAPLEAGHFRQFRNDLDMPVVVIVDCFAYRRRMNHEVERGPVQHLVEAHQRIFQHSCQAGIHGALVILVRGPVRFWQQPHLEREARCVRSKRDEMLVLADNPLASIALLPDDVAENTALFLVVVVPAVVDFFPDAPRHDRQGHQLRVGVIDGRPGSFSMVFENEDVAKALIIFQIQHTVAISPEHVLHGTFGQGGERCKMVWRFDHNFVRADSIHLVEETLSLAVQFTLDAQCWKLVGHNPDAPARRVWASAVPPIDEDFRGSSSFIAHAERAIFLFPCNNTLT